MEVERNKIGISGIGIPSEVFFNPNLTPIEKNLFGIVQLLSKSSKGCYATNSYLGNTLMCKKDAISKAVNRLSEFGYFEIKIEKTKTGPKRHIFINENYRQVYLHLVQSVNDYLLHGNKEESEGDSRTLQEVAKEAIGVILKNYRGNSKQLGGLFKTITPFLYRNSNENSNVSNILSEYTHPSGASHQSSIQETPFRRIKHNTLLEPVRQKIPFPVLRNTPCWEFVKTWNESPGLHNVHDLGKVTNVLKETKSLYEQLVDGSFFRGRYFSPEWIERNKNLKERWPSWKRGQRFSHVEIMTALKNALLFYVEGYWPRNKKMLPKSLPALFHNPQTGTSWLLKGLAECPKPFAAENTIKEYDKNLTDKTLDVVGAERLNGNVRAVDTFIRKMVKEWDATVEAGGGQAISYNDFHSEYAMPQQFVYGYLDWLEEQEWIDARTVSSCYGENSGLVKRWFAELKETYDYADEGFHIHAA